MGQITAFNIQAILEKYECSTYVETGTGIGDSLRFILNFPFKKIYTIDIDEDLINSAKEKFKDQRIVFKNNLSTKALVEILPELESTDSVLFFLDAHLPGADFHKITYTESMEKYKQDSFPLEEELKLIRESRKNKNDVIVIDDLQLYEPDKCQHKTWFYESAQEKLGLKKNSQFVYDTYGNTHDIITVTTHQGYLLLIPKQESAA
jgi:hypothetical protein